MITVYGTAKKPSAPPPKSSAGTATKVYAVYRSPPIRNQVIQPPKLRPPRPHSSRWARVSGRRQRAATKPSALTSRNRSVRSEEHTSELQSPCNLVCRLLLEKKN